jgi:hypothetical protein
MTDSLVDKNGDTIPNGSLITWNTWDSDDYVTWKMVGVVKDYTQLEGVFHSDTQYVIYLGGGIDFGGGIGNRIPFWDVVSEAGNNDPEDAGITVLGKASDVPNILKKEFGI